jgi:hypothetical protein
VGLEVLPKKQVTLWEAVFIGVGSKQKPMSMKTQLLCLLVGAGLLAGCTESRQRVGGAAETDQNVLTGGPITGTTLKDLPQPVRYALQQNAPGAEVADIDHSVRNGQVIYEISFTRPGRNPKIYITRDGEILSSAQIAK